MLRYLIIVAIFLVVTVAGALAAHSTSRVLIVPQGGQTGAITPVIVISTPAPEHRTRVANREAKLLVAGRASDEKGIASVTVNGSPAKLNDRGDFSAETLLKPGKNQVTVVAVDTAGNRGIEKFDYSRQADEVAPFDDDAASDGESGKNYALVIGINRYRRVTPLHTAVNDASEVAKVLKEQYDFTPVLLLDEMATRENILKELSSLRNRMSANDSLIIFYAGHGSLDKVTETSYWLPVDADQSFMGDWLEAKTVTDELKRSQARQILIVADSCYSGTISRSIVPRSEEEGIKRETYLKRMSAKHSRVLISSGGDEPVSDSGGSGHSVFTDVLLQALKKPFDRRFTAEELTARQLKEPVAGRSNQTPEFNVLRNSGHEAGDFVFSKKK